MGKTRRTVLIASTLIIVVAIGILLLYLKDVDPQPIARLFQKKHQVELHMLNSGRLAQISVSAPIPYPGELVERDALQALGTMGWERCSGPNSQWEATLQEPGPILVHQKTLYFEKGLELLVLYMKYESKGDARTLRTLKQPNNDVQMLTVLQGNEGPLISLKKSALGLTCP